jgi:cytochrome c
LQKRRAAAGNLVGHGGPIKAVRAEPLSARVLTGSFDYAMMLWDVSGETPRGVSRLDDHGGAVNAVAFLPDGRRALSAADDGKIALWDLDGAQLLHRFDGHEGKAVGLAVSADGRLAASAGWDGTARLYDLERRQPGPVLEGHKGPVNAVTFLDGGRQIATASADGTIGLYDAAGSFVRPLYRHGWGINVLEKMPGDDMRLLFGALNGAAGIIDVIGGDILPLASAERPILALAVLDKPGLVATGDGSGTIRVFRADDGALVEEYQNPYGPVWALAFLPGGGRLYFGGLDDFASLWQIAPRAAFEPAESEFPRRFQRAGRGGDLLAEGETQFARKCSICHTLDRDGANRAGPTLHRIFGRRIATLPGYPFSPALKSLDIVWSEETVAKLFELGPDVLTPGSKMPLQRMTSARQREALIAYLRVATVDEPAPAPQNSPEKGDRK